ncbi:unnamed protein product, partial [Phytomonas sp. Hart1]
MKLTRRFLSTDTVFGISTAEIAKFRSLRDHWWDPDGPLRSLHLFNLTRISYIAEAVRQFKRDSQATSTTNSEPHTSNTNGKTSGWNWKGGDEKMILLRRENRVLDVGCGGGILSEGLARVGATVLGIDACAESLEVANAHLEEWQREEEDKGEDEKNEEGEGHWTKRLSYKSVSLFDLAQEHRGGYDVVIASEVIEHVEDARRFLQALCEVTAPGGLLILTTIDKSLRAAFGQLLLAEHLTGIVNPGTHDWRKFVPPADLTAYAARFGMQNVDLRYIFTYPDLFPSLASGKLQVNFKLTRSFDTGHYFWTGLKNENFAEEQQPSSEYPNEGEKETN